jgi:hypothetical protein
MTSANDDTGSLHPEMPLWLLDLYQMACRFYGERMSLENLAAVFSLTYIAPTDRIYRDYIRRFEPPYRYEPVPYGIIDEIYTVWGHGQEAPVGLGSIEFRAVAMTVFGELLIDIDNGAEEGRNHDFHKVCQWLSSAPVSEQLLISSVWIGMSRLGPGGASSSAMPWLAILAMLTRLVESGLQQADQLLEAERMGFGEYGEDPKWLTEFDEGIRMKSKEWLSMIQSARSSCEGMAQRWADLAKHVDS